VTIHRFAADWVERIQYPAPGAFPGAGAWLDAFLDSQSARGPIHGSEPAALADGFLWTLWLSAVPYGLWSKQISRVGMEEYVMWVNQLEEVLGQALEHFQLTLRPGTSINDLAIALASLIEGIWLNQCLTDRHPCDPQEPIATVMRRSGWLLWLGAIDPVGA
jgi:hypothetical protein